jgi:catechol 2,3-dioxygenase-like lactoylglutathione lyase family enzyme
VTAYGTAAGIDEITVAGDPSGWRAGGFTVDPDGTCRLGAVRVRLLGADSGSGIVSWSLRGLPVGGADRAPDLDGLPTARSDRAPVPPARHPNGAARLDHVVAFTPDLDRTVAALEAAGLDLRRVREAELPGGGTRQAFFRLGQVVLEAIEQPAPDGSPVDRSKPARLWGLAVLAPDLEATAAVLGERLGKAREAIQPGRRIATVRREAGLGAAVAFITPEPWD